MNLSGLKAHICFIVLFIIIPFSFVKGDDINGKAEEVKTTFANQELLLPIFEKLYALEHDTTRNNNRKINIVHIGDSHIQADYFTNTIRTALQNIFGNGGVGFTFPYSLIRTNGPRHVKYLSNTGWESLLNVSPIADVGIGLSGIALYTPKQDFVLQLSTDSTCGFNTVKIIYPTENPQYKMSVTAEPLQVSASGKATASTIGMKYHKIKSGESLSSIARKHKVTVAQIKKANGLKSDMIHPNKTLKIPVKAGAAKPIIQESNLKPDSIDYVNLISEPYFSAYISDTTLTQITILPAEKSPMYNLNGFVIENNQSGIIYHSIGVNGAQMKDYNKYPLFFKQLPILEPDLIILSFGTNESYGRMSDTQYIYQLNEFVKNIRELNKDAVILAMTPPPSLHRQRRPNNYIVGYSTALMNLTDIPVWDLYSRMGGASSIGTKGQFGKLMDRRKIHYNETGYQMQGEMFISDFIEAYTNYKNEKEIGNDIR